MSEPSDYELLAWDALQRVKEGLLSRGVGWTGGKLSDAWAALGITAGKYLNDHPKTQVAVSRGNEIVTEGVRVAGIGIHKVAEAIPDWGWAAVASMRQATVRVSRIGLSPKRVVALHRKRGHDVKRLTDVRRLDLEEIDEVRGRGASWYYPALAALSGAGSAFVISGSEVAVAASGGVAAAPSGLAVLGVFAGDAAIVLGLSSRVVGQVSLHYGYDPEEPAEKLFVMSVVNAGSAMSAAAKAAAMTDVSRLTQALVRGKPWATLNEAVVTRVATRAADAFGIRLTKKGLGKVVPAFGVVVGVALNWATLESIVDAADVAYRRRFLLDKYPQLAAEESSEWFSDVTSEVPDEGDETLSVIKVLADSGGPDLLAGELGAVR